MLHFSARETRRGGIKRKRVERVTTLLKKKVAHGGKKSDNDDGNNNDNDNDNGDDDDGMRARGNRIMKGARTDE